MEVGTVVAIVSYDGARFAKTDIIIKVGQHHSTNPCIYERDPDSVVSWSRSRTTMVVNVPTSSPLNLLIISVIVIRGGLIMLLVVVLLLMGRRIWLASDTFSGVFEVMP